MYNLEAGYYGKLNPTQIQEEQQKKRFMDSIKFRGIDDQQIQEQIYNIEQKQPKRVTLRGNQLGSYQLNDGAIINIAKKPRSAKQQANALVLSAYRKAKKDTFEGMPGKVFKRKQDAIANLTKAYKTAKREKRFEEMAEIMERKKRLYGQGEGGYYKPKHYNTKTKKKEPMKTSIIYKRFKQHVQLINPLLKDAEIKKLFLKEQKMKSKLDITKLVKRNYMKSVIKRKPVTKKTVKKPTKKSVKKPTKKPVKKPTKKSVKKPTKKLVKKPTKKSVKKPTKKTVRKPTKKSIRKPTKKSIRKPTK